jgi:hypothetical protein
MTQSVKADDDLTPYERAVLVAWLGRRHGMSIIRANLYLDQLVAFCEAAQQQGGADGHQ